jgi:hypothetical protein
MANASQELPNTQQLLIQWGDTWNCGGHVEFVRQNPRRYITRARISDLEESSTFVESVHVFNNP